MDYATGHGLAHGLCPFGWIVAVGCPYPYCDGHDDGHGHKDPQIDELAAVRPTDFSHGNQRHR